MERHALGWCTDAMTRILALVTGVALCVGLVGCSGSEGSGSAEPSTTGVTRVSVPPTAVDGCGPGVEVVDPAKVQSDVARWSSGRPVVGGAHLWTVRSAIDVRPQHQENVWRLKFPWFTRPFGVPRIDGRRLDGEATFYADANAATDQNGTWVASVLEFSEPGCWEVSARYDDNVLRFRVRVGPE
jgi:hypothetical protein